ncbi:MAG: bifunctional glutamate N-acetyltransferase/amino-acid acetyltransferase ArgJ [Candidatus Acidulodesulfobacterium acidiphilum]|uniref:Arginine biosynthesis bifunctional protein ArgJ n=1 Tax=Candidatus Acidulodesulfobacterium acidiphilum TaxID=2597224 RepID=A0A520X9H2_9DELT|nr:MAG: bifunctional glutamate N-acetyltransferase/amino-acid acetyltransferase ArgJ [Candidatus Acidulodesulfobacterium acidiphilum]
MGKMNNFLYAGKACGLKKNKDLDLGLMISKFPLRVSAVFTKNKVKAAPVVISKKNSKNIIKALIVNSGNANACNGKQGMEDALRVVKSLAKEAGIDESSVFTCSTGVIGERLNVSFIEHAIPDLLNSADEEGFDNFTKAIMTTDTFPKTVSKSFSINGSQYQIRGSAKGSGMIMPDMATMLAFIFTDLPIKKETADKMFKECVEASFNSITVDGDTSTNDTASFFYPASADTFIDLTGNDTESKHNYQIVKNALFEVCYELAKMIVIDGEGATKFIKVTVVNASTEAGAKKTALTIANSPLFKTMITGEDLNWGRIMAAVGRAGVPLKAENIDIYINGKIIVENSTASKKLTKDIEKTILSPKEIDVEIDLKSGNKKRSVLTCNLTHGYIDINASYRS